MKRKPTGKEIRKPTYHTDNASVKEWVRIIEIINNTIGATKIEETYFRTSPCIYIIENNNNKNMIKDYYLNFNKVEDFLNNKI